MRASSEHCHRPGLFIAVILFLSAMPGPVFGQSPDHHQEHHQQSALHPAGPVAETIANVTWVLFTGGTVIFVAVMVLTLMAIVRRRESGDLPPMGRSGSRFILLWGAGIPAVILIALLIYSVRATLELSSHEAEDADLTIEVIGYQWWWEVRYPDHGIVTANEIHVPAGKTVRFVLSSADVIHSFWVPRLGGKRDLLPDHTTILSLRADEVGVYRGQCAEYCGLQHANMAFNLVALPPDAFEHWLEQRRQPPPPPEDPVARRGLEAFVRVGCGECHAIRGTVAVGRSAPDLTHFGSRQTIGAGMMPNTHGHLAGWIAQPQALKPGNHMPASYLDPEDLHAIIIYLQSLD